MTDPASVPDDLIDLLTTDHIGHVSWARQNGQIAGCLMWVDWDGEHVVTSSPVGSGKGRAWRRNPEVRVSVVDHDDDWRYVQVSGRVTEIRRDVGLEFIDKMSVRYTGSAYGRRSGEREIFVITPDDIRFGHGGWSPRRR